MYIGQTVKSIEQRFRGHISAANKGSNTKIARAIRKYGKENFVVEMIDSAKNKEELNEKERFWIRFFNADKIGYNMTAGGESANTYENKTSSEMDIIKDKIKRTKLGQLNPNSRKVKCFNVNTKEELHFSTLKECQEYFNEKHHNFITRRCKKEISYLYNGVWEIAYEEEDYNNKYTKEKKNRKSRKIQIKDIQTKEVHVFPSYASAERHYGLRKKAISGKAYEKGKFFVFSGKYEITVLN